MVTACNTFAVQHIEEFVCGGVLIRSRRAANLEDLHHEDVLDIIKRLVEQNGEVVSDLLPVD